MTAKSSSSLLGEGLPNLVVGGFLLSTGIFAYVKTGSRVFLFGGVLVGAANVIGGTMIDTGHAFTGHLLGGAGNMVIATTGIARLISTKRPMPAIPFVSLGLASTAYHLFKASYCIEIERSSNS